MPRLRSGFLAILALFPAASSTARPDSPDQAARESLTRMFGDSIAVSSMTLRLSAGERDTLAAQSRSRWPSDTVKVYRCQAHGIVLGYGFLDDVKGKTQLITYVVGVDTSGRVRDINVLVYRESYGGEIAFESFRKQFREKSADDKLTPGKDIRNISGATISVRAVADGVKRILATFALLRPAMR